MSGLASKTSGAYGVGSWVRANVYVCDYGRASQLFPLQLLRLRSAFW